MLLVWVDSVLSVPRRTRPGMPHLQLRPSVDRMHPCIWQRLVPDMWQEPSSCWTGFFPPFLSSSVNDFYRPHSARRWSRFNVG